MKIGLITSYEDRRSEALDDLRVAITRSGHEPCDFYVDKVGVRMGKGRVSLVQSIGKIHVEKIDLAAALMRSIGTVKDYEQFGHRIWTVMALELNGTCVMNKIESWIPASDKFATLVTLAKAGLPVPETVSSEDFFIGYGTVKEFGSTVIKPLRSGMGLGIFKIDDPDVAMHVFNAFTSLNKPLYVQRFLEKKGDGDYRVIVVGGEAIGAEFRKGKTWKSNLAQGAVPVKARLTDELAELSIKATKAMKLDFAGVDIAETRDGYFILETNPSIRWTGFKKTTGIDPAERIVRHLLKKARA